MINTYKFKLWVLGHTDTSFLQAAFKLFYCDSDIPHSSWRYFYHLSFILLNFICRENFYYIDEVYLKFDLICHVLICYSHSKSCSELIKLFVFHMGKDFM